MEKNECENGCHRYNQSMDDVLKAAAKHRDAALALKDVTDKQKAKLAKFREQRMAMQNLVDQLELDLDLEREFTGKVCSEKKTLEIEVKTLKEIIANKEEHDKLQPYKCEF